MTPERGTRSNDRYASLLRDLASLPSARAVAARRGARGRAEHSDASRAGERSRAQQRFSRLIGEERARKNTWDVADKIASVTAQAVVIAFKFRVFALPIPQVEGVEYGPQLWIDDDHFRESAGHPSDIGGIGKVERTRPLRADPVALQTRLRKNQQLALDRDVERIEHCFQRVSFATGEPELARCETRLQIVECTRFGDGVANGRLLEIRVRLREHPAAEGYHSAKDNDGNSTRTHAAKLEPIGKSEKPLISQLRAIGANRSISNS